ncbi:MAG: helix-turn-helix transcriptional regulator [Mogibacterium sp.]|nr:helix-turn-helix transcriptional regulator [Mogibacterium sp.]
MDQVKIGKFIAERRKEQGLTQAYLAEKLNITDRAVSKWETGKSLPDSSIMLELCELLKINVNELLSGELLDMDEYKKMAEENLLKMRMQEEEANRKLLSLEWVIGVGSSLIFFLTIFAGSYAVMDKGWRIALISCGTIIFLIGAFYALRIEQTAGYYECPECGERYVPSMMAVFIAPHFGRTRKMRCPNCGKRAYQKKVLTKD